jgi:hypothetical protein
VRRNRSGWKSPESQYGNVDMDVSVPARCIALIHVQRNCRRCRTSLTHDLSGLMEGKAAASHADGTRSTRSWSSAASDAVVDGV